MRSIPSCVLVVFLAFMSILPSLCEGASSGTAPDTAMVGAKPVRETIGLGWLEQRKELRVVHLQGSPYDMGYQQGVLLREEIAKVRPLLYPVEPDRSFLQRLWGAIAGFYHRTLVLGRMRRDIPVAYLEEMRGIAAGTGGEIDFDELLKLQYLYENVWLGGCAFSVTGGLSGDNSVLHAQNLDTALAHELAQLTTVFIREPEEGNKSLSVGWPGMVGTLHGMNEAGLSVSANVISLDEVPGDGEGGTPTSVLLRESIQYAVSIGEVLATFSGWPRVGGASVLVTTASGEAALIEASPTRISLQRPEGGVLATTHFFTSPAMVPLSRRQWELNDGRYERLSALLEAFRGRLNVTAATGILRDRYDALVQREGPYEFGISNALTAISVVMDSVNRRVWIAIADERLQAPYLAYRPVDLWREVGQPVSSGALREIQALPWPSQSTHSAYALFRRTFLTDIIGEWGTGSWLRAAGALEQVVAMDPAQVPLYWLGVAYLNTQRLTDSVSILQLAAQHPAAHPYWRKASLVRLGTVYELLGKHSQAQECYMAALAIRIPRGHFAPDREELDREAQGRLISRSNSR